MIMMKTKANIESNGSSPNFVYYIDGSTQVTMSNEFGVKTEELERTYSVKHHSLTMRTLHRVYILV